MRSALIAASLVWVVAVFVAAQEPASLQPTFRTGVDVVQVDVSVLDKDRKPITGLSEADFTVLEDGRPRPIVAFVPVVLADPERVAAGAPWLREVPPDVATNAVRPEGRLVVIMFDWSIRVEDQGTARRIAAGAVDQLGPGDLAAVIFSSGFGNAGIPQNFTSDRSRLLAAINRPFVVAKHNEPKGSPFHDPRNDNGVMIDDPEGYESGECYCRMCGPDTIASVADALRDVRGRRKTLLFIGTYVRLFEGLQGPTTRQGPEFRVPGARGLPVVHPGVCAAYLKDARQKMERATSLANLTVYSVDPVGLETGANSPMGGSIIGQIDRRNDLLALADSTGGRAVMNTNAPETLLPDVFAESHSFYLLAFTPADLNAKGKFHKIEVKVNRPGASVRTRAGYYTGETKVKATAPSLLSPETAAALEGVLPRTDLPLSVAVAPFATPGKPENAVAIVLGVAQPPPTTGGPNPSVKVLAAAFDRNGRSAQSEEQTVGITRHANGGAAHYEVLSRLALKPGHYEVRVGFDGGPSERASVYTFVDVPDFAEQPLSLSGIALHAEPAVLSAPADTFANLLPIVPTARRTFARADRATAYIQVYEKSKGPAQPAGIAAHIEDAHGRSVFDNAMALGADRFARDRRAGYQLALPLERLEPGEYLLTIDATQGKLTARRGLRFTVR